ncbi:Spy/CpxP family protein refolding chaperone [Magnetospirillum fulvum]|uniref:LTXXQ motif family protein n=1 Tax=Magnetospirillum fulvum TaxID=1082 RepID=A0A1H6H533_MAGFU|nr:Spy/CpxP family protein refolding chaperone [Magnetospirillum fulvum]SEH30831.1 LTXXQ motif family protein [Magnetospirillum fulvum]
MVKPYRALLFVLPLMWSSLALAESTHPGQKEPALTQQDLTARHVKACDDHYARRGGELGYQEARFKLTEAQKSAFAKYRQDSLAAAESIRTACHANGPKLGSKPTVLERDISKEAHLKLELQTLQETRPALEAFYATLTPAQKEIFDQEPDNKPMKAGKAKPRPSEKN